MPKFLGLDTSNYTTSAAVFDGTGGGNVSRLLDVEPGRLGLRQSDALFAHVKRLPEVIGRLASEYDLGGISAVAASTRPRSVEGSYMPCFAAGESQGRTIAAVLGVPFFAFSHQEGHIAAAAWSAWRLDLLDRPHLAWHLSGGTTELLLVTPEGSGIRAERIGGSSDLAAGQLVDRTGRLLGLGFPAGKELDRLSAMYDKDIYFTPKIDGLEFSLSGLENKIKKLCEDGEKPENTAFFTIKSIGAAIETATAAAVDKYSDLPVVCSGGVASNAHIRKLLTGKAGAVFARPEFSTDNAMGIAVLAHRQFEARRGIGG